MKKLCTLLLTCMLVISFSHFAFAEDLVPPKLNSVTLDKEIYGGGDTLNITLNVNDDNSGIKYVFLYVESPSKSQFIDGYAVRQPDGTYQFVRKLNNYAEEGIWRISWIELEDNANNQISYQNGTEFNKTFNVINPNSDVTKPILEGVTLGKTEVNAGESLPITVKASDNLSGVYMVQVFAENTSGQTAYLQINDQDSNGNWSGELNIGENAASGTWKIRTLNIWDKARNQGPSNPEIPFTVVNLNEDKEPPVLDGISLDSPEVIAGDNLHLTVNAHDNISGIKSITASLSNKTNHQFINVDVTEKDADGNWIASVPIPKESELGKWKVNYVQMYDKAGNQKLYVNDQDFSLYFTVIDEVQVINNLLTSIDGTLNEDINAINFEKVSNQLMTAKQKIDALSDESQKGPLLSHYEAINQHFNDLEKYNEIKTQFEAMTTINVDKLDIIESNINIFMDDEQKLKDISTINESKKNDLITNTRNVLSNALIQYIESHHAIQQKLLEPTLLFMVENDVIKIGAKTIEDKNTIMKDLMPTLKDATTGEDVLDAVEKYFQ